MAYSITTELKEWFVNESEGKAHSSKDPVIVLLADGMGGSEAGEVASSLAIQGLKEYLQDALQLMPSDPEELILIVKNGFLLAHDRIVSEAHANIRHKGMGTTLIVGIIYNEQVFVVWSGDSRLYRYYPGELDQQGNYHVPHIQLLTQDHSMVWQMVQHGELTPEEARVHPYSNIITQSLGDTQSRPRPDYVIAPIYQNDLLLFCSDGLNSMLPDDQIRDVCSDMHELLDLAEALIRESNQAGGADNISVVLVKVNEGMPRPHLLDAVRQDQIVTIGGTDITKGFEVKESKVKVKSIWTRLGLHLPRYLLFAVLISTMAAMLWIFRTHLYMFGKQKIEWDGVELETQSNFQLDTVGNYGEFVEKEIEYKDAKSNINGKIILGDPKIPYWQFKFDSLLQEIIDLRMLIERDSRLSLEVKGKLTHDIDPFQKYVEGLYNEAIQRRLFGNAAEKIFHSSMSSLIDLKRKYKICLEEINFNGPISESEFWKFKISSDST